MKVQSAVLAMMLMGACSGDSSTTDRGTTTDALDRTTPVDSTSDKSTDVGRDTSDTGTRKTYPSGG